MTAPAKLTKVSVNLPFGIGGAEWESDPTERRAAWALYVELVTRVVVQEMDREDGVLRESLSSLHSLFGTTREILREAGPNVGISKKSVGGIAITVLNHGLRPFLTEWHPRLQTWEAQRTPDTSPPDHEKVWPEASALRDELERLREELSQYAEALAKIASAE